MRFCIGVVDVMTDRLEGVGGSGADGAAVGPVDGRGSARAAAASPGGVDVVAVAERDAAAARPGRRCTR
jgi:hypothetical protein